MLKEIAVHAFFLPVAAKQKSNNPSYYKNIFGIEALDKKQIPHSRWQALSAHNYWRSLCFQFYSHADSGTPPKRGRPRTDRNDVMKSNF